MTLLLVALLVLGLGACCTDEGPQGIGAGIWVSDGAADGLRAQQVPTAATPPVTPMATFQAARTISLSGLGDEPVTLTIEAPDDAPPDATPLITVLSTDGQWTPLSTEYDERAQTATVRVSRAGVTVPTAATSGSATIRPAVLMQPTSGDVQLTWNWLTSFSTLKQRLAKAISEAASATLGSRAIDGARCSDEAGTAYTAGPTRGSSLLVCAGSNRDGAGTFQVVNTKGFALIVLISNATRTGGGDASVAAKLSGLGLGDHGFILDGHAAADLVATGSPVRVEAQTDGVAFYALQTGFQALAAILGAGGTGAVKTGAELAGLVLALPECAAAVTDNNLPKLLTSCFGDKALKQVLGEGLGAAADYALNAAGVGSFFLTTAKAAVQDGSFSASFTRPASSSAGSSEPPSTDTSAAAAPPRFVAFTTPSRNIGCYISALSDQSDPANEARCDINEFDYQLPPRPDGCDGDIGVGGAFGQAITLGATGPAALLCYGDTALNDEVVPYGTTVTAGVFSCTVAETGVTCTNTATGHGFALSKRAYALQ